MHTTRPATARTARRIVALSVAAAALTGLVATPSHAAAKRPAAAAKTCKVATLDASASKHTESWRDGGVTAEDDWPSAQALCNNENVTGIVHSTSQMQLVPKSAANKTSGKIRGKVTLGYSFGANQTGTWNLVGTSNYTCSGGTCETRMKLTKPGQPNQIIAILIGLFRAEPGAQYFKVTFEDVLISSIVSPRDPASGLPTGKRVAVSKG